MARELPQTQFSNPCEFLAALYAGAKAILGGFSYVRFAEALGFGKTNMLRLIIVGQRPLTLKVAQKIAVALQMTGPQRRYFTTLTSFGHERDAQRREQLLHRVGKYRSNLTGTRRQKAVQEDQQAFLESWLPAAILEMSRLHDFEGNFEWVHQNLLFTAYRPEIDKALDLLKRLGLITGSGRRGKNATVKTPHEVDDIGAISYHRAMLEVAKEAITVVPHEKRELVALTARLPRGRIPEFKERIRKLIDAFESESQKRQGNDVYQLNVQLFPFTKGRT